MLWSFVLPFYVTCFVLAAAVILATIAAPKFRWRRGKMFAWMTLYAMLAFIPSCTVVMKAANAVRLGVGRYENVGAIWEERFKRWLPEEATDIVVRKHLQGYEARFKIDRKLLDAWFDRCWANAREKALPRTEPELDESFDPAKIEAGFGELGKAPSRWPSPKGRGDVGGDAKWMKYEGPRRLNWAGAKTWFDEKSGVAYQHTGFW